MGRGMGTDSGEKAGHRADSVVHDVLLEMTLTQQRARKSGECVCRGRDSSRTPLSIINREGYMTLNPALHSNQAVQ